MFNVMSKFWFLLSLLLSLFLYYRKENKYNVFLLYTNKTFTGLGDYFKLSQYLLFFKNRKKKKEVEDIFR